ncbi:MAG: aminotransferase class I/II-fold pyridoxal phosphate-dependent enzyme [Bacilli bacterium]
MKKELKKVAKKILGRETEINHSSVNPKNFSKALEQYTNENPDLLNERNVLGPRKNHNPFYDAIKEMEPSYNFFNVDVYDYGSSNVPEISEYDGLHSGTPMRTKPLSLSIKAIKKSLHFKNLYWYPSTVGSTYRRQNIVSYLKREGFKIDKTDSYDGLGVENIVFTCSTTHAYSLILNTIAHDEDVVLLTGPNYGIFAIMTELTSAHVEILDLKEEDDWYVNPESLSKRIDEINKKLKTKFKGKKLGYTPRVVAFLNMNPHNPTGKVMSKKNKEILYGIGDVCLEKGVFVIDDLIYRDLTFDQDNLALPLAANPKYFNNTISLFGLSKAFGLASLRAGFVVAPYPIVRALANNINHSMDSIPVPLVESVAAAFNGTDRRYKVVKNFLKPIIAEYQYRYNLLKALVNGINTIPDCYHSRVISDVRKYSQDENEVSELLHGLKNVSIRKGTEPDSGFFAILDFTGIKGKKTKEYTINTDKDLLRYLYEKGKIRFIMGSNMCWPNKDEIIARVTFGLDIKALVYNFSIINKSLKELK